MQCESPEEMSIQWTRSVWVELASSRAHPFGLTASPYVSATSEFILEEVVAPIGEIGTTCAMDKKGTYTRTSACWRRTRRCTTTRAFESPGWSTAHGGQASFAMGDSLAAAGCVTGGTRSTHNAQTRSRKTRSSSTSTSRLASARSPQPDNGAGDPQRPCERRNDP